MKKFMKFNTKPLSSFGKTQHPAKHLAAALLVTATLTFTGAVTTSSFARAENTQANDDGAYLDAPYFRGFPSTFKKIELAKDPAGDSVPMVSPIRAVIAKQSKVRSQANRGTCSIFASTALFESMLAIQYPQQFSVQSLDLSEEWLEYLVVRTKQEDGASSYENFQMISKYGMPTEPTFPYIGETWKTVESSPLAKLRCGSITEATTQTSCLLAHRNPSLLFATNAQLSEAGTPLFDKEFAKARSEARALKSKFLTQMNPGPVTLHSETLIKKTLAAGTPITLDLDFYYGAWNHRRGTEFGLVRKMDEWSKGIVTYPEPGSLDLEKSREEDFSAGHSIVLVGYDDQLAIDTKIQMSDGTFKTITLKGFYFFKNSWGTENFGVKFTLNGEVIPGYGMISQKYAHEYGSFHKMVLVKPEE